MQYIYIYIYIYMLSNAYGIARKTSMRLFRLLYMFVNENEYDQKYWETFFYIWYACHIYFTNYQNKYVVFCI